MFIVCLSFSSYPFWFAKWPISGCSTWCHFRRLVGSDRLWHHRSAGNVTSTNVPVLLGPCPTKGKLYTFKLEAHTGWEFLVAKMKFCYVLLLPKWAVWLKTMAKGLWLQDICEWWCSKLELYNHIWLFICKIVGIKMLTKLNMRWFTAVFLRKLVFHAEHVASLLDPLLQRRWPKAGAVALLALAPVSRHSGGYG